MERLELYPHIGGILATCETVVAEFAKRTCISAMSTCSENVLSQIALRNRGNYLRINNPVNRLVVYRQQIGFAGKGLATTCKSYLQKLA